MDTQKTVFLGGEADQWFRRNGEAITRQYDEAIVNPQSDPILGALIDIRPKRMLEIGASNGWRLNAAGHLWNARTYGIEPSAQAVHDGNSRYPQVSLQVGTADHLPFESGSMDCVVFGFCLYLCDRTDLFRIAAEADRVLESIGYLVVLDFFPPAPYRNAYSHKSGVFSHKMDHSTLWSWHPGYTLWSHAVVGHCGTDPTEPDNRLAVTVLRKS